ncbi:unnamed protein product [Protopolystoma xenopodis]|uniref:PTB domain-containing protein n=1 Tax=Protopolystoma xenopodis TaxID=117903 RepID=A0A3S5CBC6_9PLAT|nr:unnamed protein product [Protopolystoma xenopodis]
MCPPGTFVVRNSGSFARSFGLAIKVDRLPDSLALHQRSSQSDTDNEFVRHYLIESLPARAIAHSVGVSSHLIASSFSLHAAGPHTTPDPSGPLGEVLLGTPVRLRGPAPEATFTNLVSFIYEHLAGVRSSAGDDEFSLPYRLLAPFELGLYGPGGASSQLISLISLACLRGSSGQMSGGMAKSLSPGRPGLSNHAGHHLHRQPSDPSAYRSHQYSTHQHSYPPGHAQSGGSGRPPSAVQPSVHSRASTGGHSRPSGQSGPTGSSPGHSTNASGGYPAASDTILPPGSGSFYHTRLGPSELACIQPGSLTPGGPRARGQPGLGSRPLGGLGSPSQPTPASILFPLFRIEYHSLYLQFCHSAMIAIYLGSIDSENLTGTSAVSKAVDVLLENAAQVKQTEVSLKVTGEGLVVTDTWRKLFFRRHYPGHTISYCGVDPHQRW